MTYKKLNLTLKDFDFSKIISEEITFHNGRHFTEFKIKNKDYLDNYLDKKIKFHIQPDIINFTKITYPGTPIHTDKWKTSINYYPFDIPENEYTIILNKHVDKLDSNVLNYDSFFTRLNIVKHDCYLLNTHAYHKVFIPNTNSIRYILRFVWMNNSIEEVYRSLEIF